MEQASDSGEVTPRQRPSQSAELLSKVYDELRRLAARQFARERPGQTLQPTALVHEAWLRLNESHKAWAGENEFMAAAANAMRRILVEEARRRSRIKRGGGYSRLLVPVDELAASICADELLELDEALDQLGEVHPCAAQLVNLRFFGGFTQLEAAKQLDISRSMADRTWLFARTWLFRRVRPLATQRQPT